MVAVVRAPSRGRALAWAGADLYVAGDFLTAYESNSSSVSASRIARWDGATWTLEWSRTMINENPFDLQFDDPDAAYSFLVKVFEGIEGRPDPVSERHILVFQPGKAASLYP